MLSTIILNTILHLLRKFIFGFTLPDIHCCTHDYWVVYMYKYTNTCVYTKIDTWHIIIITIGKVIIFRFAQDNFNQSGGKQP